MKSQYVSGATIRKTYEVSSSSLRSWAEQGKIKVVRSQFCKGKRLYCFGDFAHLMGLSSEEDQKSRRRICYARVSSQHQHADLERQCAELQRIYPNHELIKDIGSGLNWKRPGFLVLLDAVCRGTVTEIVVAHRDRLARIGTELLEWLFQRHNTSFLVVDHAEERQSESEELSEDLLAVVTFFVARNNGRRSAANRKRRAANTCEQGERKRRKTKEE
jgi:predicted site-specific integrase-resolvase